MDWGREILTGEDLEDGREKEATSLYESEELAEEDDEGDQAENGGENHERLHCLKPVWQIVEKHRESGVNNKEFIHFWTFYILLLLL